MPGTRPCGTIIVAKILKILVNSPLFLVFLFIPLLFLFLLEAIPIIIPSIPYYFRTFALRKQQNPNDLMKELHCCLIQLEEIIGRINLTNINTKNAEGLSITQMIAKKDTLTMRIGILRNCRANRNLHALPEARSDLPLTVQAQQNSRMQGSSIT